MDSASPYMVSHTHTHLPHTQGVYQSTYIYIVWPLTSFKISVCDEHKVTISFSGRRIESTLFSQRLKNTFCSFFHPDCDKHKVTISFSGRRIESNNPVCNVFPISFLHPTPLLLSYRNYQTLLFSCALSHCTSFELYLLVFF
jgi:hypothetical protein